ncbi:Protein ANTAGONIST OF LIKE HETEROCHROMATIN PROTEIN 1 [Frankliniella fusca]|uniref:Protein ANTAGONIST OF LIKE HETEROCHROMATIN PROTEIN 1 n=1 Tax=Frankliniella fusca TaxID=407009 RepID=A0AAE1GYD0_9NEOP|nr:Protein ANTAGONIST OF LIKE HETEROCHROMATIN PROTEIN 1 [Frankliniella fusca]
MDLDEVAYGNAIEMLEQVLIEEYENDRAIGLLLGRMGANIMGMLEDGCDLEENQENFNWERVEVNVDEYRRMGDPSFKRHFRLSKPTYEKLVLTLAEYLLESGRVLRIRSSIDIPLLMVLWIMANPDTFRSVALRFGVLPGVVHFHYAYIIEALREMGSMYIRWPNEQERQGIKARFEAYSGLPGIVGVLDGTYQNVTAPKVQKDRFRNRHHTYAFNTMAVCDDNLLIRDLYVGEVGSMHDQRVFRRSPLYQKLVRREGLLQPDEHIIGDSAYQIMDSVLPPFRNVGNLTAAQRAYNYALCKCRARIEHAFGKAFGQWRRMKMLHSCNIELAVDHFTASYVLHNFMILNGEKLIDLDPDDGFIPDEEDLADRNEEEEEEDDDDDDGQEGGAANANFAHLVRQAHRAGVLKRTQLLQLFM